MTDPSDSEVVTTEPFVYSASKSPLFKGSASETAALPYLEESVSFSPLDDLGSAESPAGIAG